MAKSVYKGYEHLGSTISQFYPTIDFVKGELGVSLKSVNAQKNFDFKNIKDNIDNLAALKSAGVSNKFGREIKISDVRLDIAIPKGYDKSVLNDVIEYANEKLGADRVKIFETKK